MAKPKLEARPKPRSIKKPKIKKRKTVKTAVGAKKVRKRIPKAAKRPVKRVATAKKRITKTVRLAVFVRAEGNPIIVPKPQNGWEAWQTFNPGVVLIDGKVHILYRAIGEDGLSRLGYALSNDGFKIDERLPNPVYEHRLEQ